jgi:hypothetical protein
MAARDALYDAFTGQGVLATHWNASGVRTQYDSETKELSIDIPVGWTDRMSEETRRFRTQEWCLDAPTFNVDYALLIATTDGKVLRQVNMIATEHEDDTISFRTNVQFEPLRGVCRGTALHIDLVARVKVTKGDPRILPLIVGEAIVPEQTRWLSGNTPGFFFVADAGFIVSMHTLPEALDKMTLTHVSFMGRMKNFEI